MRVRNALARVDLPLLGLWIALSAGLSAITTSVRDWFAMTNELLYERRAISAAQTLSPLPRLHGQLISSYDQLYPLLIAPVFRYGTVPQDIYDAHLLNAWIMASACIPAYLLARRVTGSRPLSYIVALLAVCMPWILFASFLMTEVAAYPALLWALLALQRTAVAPSRRNDVLTLLAIALAFFARTQFALLFFVLPLGLLAYERGRVRVILARHRLLMWTYAALALTAIALLAVGRLSSSLGVYGDTISGNLVPSGIGRSFVEHLAVVSLGVGILPLVAGGAWLVAGVVRPSVSPEIAAFASIGAVFVLFQTLQVTIFDLRYSGGPEYVHDRYLLYLAPVVVLAFVCALRDRHRPRWSIVLPTALVVLGFAFGSLPGFTWQEFETVNSDAPIAAFIRPVASFAGGLGGARALLAGGTVLLTVLFVLANRLLRRDRTTAVFLALVLLALPALTAYMFVRLFGVNDWADRAITNPQIQIYDWVDVRIGASTAVSMVPYPVSSAFLVSQRVWRDYEFWNKSINRDVQYGGPWFFKYTGDTFPQRRIRFDSATGLAAASPTRYVLQADQETRFHIFGTAIAQQEGTELIDAARPWRADWITFGLYPDGWTQPRKAVRIRVFAIPGQRTGRIRTLTVGVRAPADVSKRNFSLRSDVQHQEAVAMADTVRVTVSLCVPALGYTDVLLAARGSSTIPGDLRDYNLAEFTTRRGGIFVAEIALADEIGGSCEP